MRSRGHCRSCVGLRLQTGLAGWLLKCCRSLRRLRTQSGPLHCAWAACTADQALQPCKYIQARLSQWQPMALGLQSSLILSACLLINGRQPATDDHPVRWSYRLFPASASGHLNCVSGLRGVCLDSAACRAELSITSADPHLCGGCTGPRKSSRKTSASRPLLRSAPTQQPACICSWLGRLAGCP